MFFLILSSPVNQRHCGTVEALNEAMRQLRVFVHPQGKINVELKREHSLVMDQKSVERYHNNKLSM